MPSPLYCPKPSCPQDEEGWIALPEKASVGVEGSAEQGERFFSQSLQTRNCSRGIQQHGPEHSRRWVGNYRQCHVSGCCFVSLFSVTLCVPENLQDRAERERDNLALFPVAHVRLTEGRGSRGVKKRSWAAKAVPAISEALMTLPENWPIPTIFTQIRVSKSCIFVFRHFSN